MHAEHVERELMIDSLVHGRRLAVGVLVAILLTAVVGGVGAWLIASKPIWILFGFEVVVASACVIGLLWLWRRPVGSPGLGLACLGGSIAASTFLSWLAVRNVPIAMPQAGVIVLTWLATRVGAGALLCLIGAADVVHRDARSRGYLLKSAIAGVGLAVLVGVLSIGGVRRAVLDMPGWAGFATASFFFILLCVLISAAGHCAIRAFECGIRRPHDAIEA